MKSAVGVSKSTASPCVRWVTCSLSQTWQTIRPGARSQGGETSARKRRRWIYNVSEQSAAPGEAAMDSPHPSFFCVQVRLAAGTSTYCRECICARACDKPVVVALL